MFEQPLWHGFLERLRARTGATYVSLAFRPIDEERIVELYSGPPMSRQMGRLFDEKYVRDPLPYRQMREGRIYTMEELLNTADAFQQAYRDEFLKGIGVTNMRLMRVSEPSGIDAWLSCAGGREIGSAVSALLTALASHLRIALRTFVAFEREKFRSSVTSEAFGRLNFGWLTLDAQCRIIDMTPNLEQIFQRSSVLRRGRYDRLMPASPAIDRELSTLVKSFAADAEGKPRAINLSRDPLIDMLIRPVQDRSLSAQSLPVAIAYISGDRWSQADRCDQLVDLFGLLPSEARFAWAIAQGMTIAEAAEDLGLTVETARNYSKKIYAKTGSRGQAELVRNILTSVLALA
ncbi:helix-turn-helix transcriptional regulator [Sphingobium sp.]|uniref:helix-turn-helix transcriptional regulator n=1 Tax=Sphingobium sp. TaxID=1912891 RepID=UPI0035C75A68